MSDLLGSQTLIDAVQVLMLGCGAASALLLFGLLVWTWRDVSARSRDLLARGGALLLVLVLNIFGLVLYLLLRPRETLAEKYEREMIEEILARELTGAALTRPAAARPAGPARPPERA